MDLHIHPLVLGRSPGSSNFPGILHRTVSRSHFRVEWSSRLGVHLGKDLNSRNGSTLNGRALRPNAWHRLRTGDVLRIGDVIFVYESSHTLEIKDSPSVNRLALPGNAQGIRQLRSRVARAATDISPVLIIGETGTGKERLAAEIHRLSRRSGDFVAVNCATFGEQLIESQLFGHVRGAFTGASTDQPGLFRAAHQGTLFLDEIGEMPLELQPRLLRAIQEGEIRPLGSAETVKVDVRVVAATHRDLSVAAKNGDFRQDLYARLALWQLHLPAVRDRRVDILFWVARLHELWMNSRGMTGSPMRWTTDAAQRLLLAPWPENLRGIDRLVHNLATEQTLVEHESINDDATWPPARPNRSTLSHEPIDDPDGLEAPTDALVRATNVTYRRLDLTDLPTWIDEAPV